MSIIDDTRIQVASNMTGSYGDHYFLLLIAYVLSQDIANNRSTVRADLYIDYDVSGWDAYMDDPTYGNIDVNHSSGNYSVSNIHFTEENNYRVLLGTRDITVNHNSNGTCPNIYVAGYWDTNTWRMGDGFVEGEVAVPTIPRQTSITSFTVSKRSGYTTSLTFNWQTADTIDYAWYSTNNGSSWTGVDVTDGKSGSFNVTGLSAGTSYNCKIRVRRKDSQMITDSSKVTQSTYPNTVPTITLSSKTVNSITVSSSCNVDVSSTQYRIKTSGGSYGSYQNSGTFSNLTPNTSYTIEVKKVSSDGNISGTATINVTTYQIAILNAINNMNHGDNLTVTYSNPSGATINICITNAVGDTIYLDYRSCSGSSYTFNFTDADLDYLYKLYGLGNTLNLAAKIRTTANNTNYYDLQTFTLTLTGNQKTGYIKVNGNWKRTKRFVKVNGQWKRAVRWLKVDGQWRRCI